MLNNIIAFIIMLITGCMDFDREWMHSRLRETALEAVVSIFTCICGFMMGNDIMMCKQGP